MIRSALRTSFAVTVLSLLCQIGFSQVATGTPPFASFGGGPFDTVNLGNLNVHFAVPIVHKAGRGLPFNYDLSYDSSAWKPVGVSGNSTWTPAANWGWSPSMFGTVGYLSNTTTYSYCYDMMGHMTGQVMTVSNWVYHDPWGVAHKFSSSMVVYGGSCTGTNQLTIDETAGDGSGFGLHINSGGGGGFYMTARDGRVFSPPSNPTGPAATTASDANGNQITTDSSGHFYDSLSSTTAVLTVSGSSPVNFVYTAPGGPATAVMSYVTYSVKTNFGCTGVTEYGPTNVGLVDRITLPDGSYYAFTYEPTPGFSGKYTGRIAQVRLPTGGTIGYTYTGANNGVACSDGSAAGLSRTVNGGTWSYARTQVSGNHWQTKVTTPPDPQNAGSASNDTIIDFMKDSASGLANTYNFYETQRQAYQGTSTGGTLLLTTVTCWNNNTSSCTTTAVASPITQSSTTLQYPGGQQSKTTTAYSAYGPTDVTQYAYSTGSPTTVLQHTQTSYASFGNSYSKPSSVTVDDGNGHTLSQTNYTYDEYSSYPLQATTGTPQHTSVTGSRGNLTTIARKVIGTTYLYQHFSYFDTGNVYQSYDTNGAVSTYAYDATAQGSSTKSCGNSFSTSVTLPVSGLSTSMSYDCTGGVATGTVDLNGNSTSSSYNDPYFWRPASLTAPYAGAATTTTNFTYTKYNTGSGAYANVESKMLFNSNSSVADQLTTIGSYGQPLYSQQREGPSSANYDSAQVLYDSFLRAYQSSMPCVATSTSFTGQGSACPSSATTTSAFDALGRVTQTTDGGGGNISFTYNQNDVKQAIGPFPSGESLKQKQSEYDAIGRLVSVCELTGVPGYVACGQTNSFNGFFTIYAYGVNGSGYPTMTVTQGPSGSQQTRVYTYDLIGRLISETNPENGTKTYTYDSDSAGNCSGTYTGDLVKLTDAKANKICYQYDQIHRKTQISYPSGPDATNTPAKTLVYDSAAFNSTAMLNPKGRLVEAYTGSSGSKITDEFFSYSVRGELLDTWQCTPHSGTGGCSSVSNYYHVTVGFFENGALKTVGSSISGLPGQTYAVDAMGRTSAVTASAGQNPVTSTNYNLSAFSSSVTFGSGDFDTFYQDANTGRQTKYVFNVNGATNTGQTNWNNNGSLASLQITDNISGTSDTQTCNYSHDDLSRIASVNCVNGATAKWNQSFTYDRFGNIAKSSTGPGISFMPGYQASTNWITSLPGITPITDNNGQMTYDGTHNYTWDAEHNMVSVDANPANCSTSGQCLTYDALGRMAEKTSGGTYTQIVYGPQGRFATMNGQTLVQAVVSLPAAQAVYTNASLGTTNKIAYYRHADHLGSSRLATTPTRTLYSSTAYAPTGEPYAQAGTTDLSFTGQDQDTVSGMHDFLFRKFMPVQGRWLSPDPGGLAVADPTNPQSWNRYAYVLNNPMALIDPLGEDTCYWVYGGYHCTAWGETPGPTGPTSPPPCYASSQGCGSNPVPGGAPDPNGCPSGVTCGPGGTTGGSATGNGQNNLGSIKHLIHSEKMKYDDCASKGSKPKTDNVRKDIWKDILNSLKNFGGDPDKRSLDGEKEVVQQAFNHILACFEAHSLGALDPDYNGISPEDAATGQTYNDLPGYHP